MESRKDALRFVTSDDVFDETVTRLRQKADHPTAVRVGEALRASTLARVLPVLPEDRLAAWDLFVRTSRPEVSLTDCTSVVLLRRLGEREVFTFDEDFASLGFEVRPASVRRK